MTGLVLIYAGLATVALASWGVVKFCIWLGAIDVDDVW